MKTSLRFKSLLIGTIVLSSGVYGQKVNETSAAVEFKKYGKSLTSGDVSAASSSLTKAKGFIDLAAENPETKESPKTLYYRGEIYMALFFGDSPEVEPLKAIEIATESFQKAFNSGDKFKGDITESLINHKRTIDGKSYKLYTDSSYTKASSLYYSNYNLQKSIGLIDSASLYYSGVAANDGKLYSIAADRFKACAEIGYKVPNSYLLASQAYRKDKKYNEAKEVVINGRKKFSNDKGLLLELVNTSIEAGDTKAAEASLVEALATDPTNKQLYYVIGTIYMDLKQPSKAEEMLKKAIELDPTYTDALYQLGAHYLSVASGIREEASRLKFGDKNYEPMIAKSDEVYKQALVPLENYLSKEPNDKAVLTIVSQIYKSLKNTAKALEYKKRADEAK